MEAMQSCRGHYRAQTLIKMTEAPIVWTGNTLAKQAQQAKKKKCQGQGFDSNIRKSACLTVHQL